MHTITFSIHKGQLLVIQYCSGGERWPSMVLSIISHELGVIATKETCRKYGRILYVCHFFYSSPIIFIFFPEHGSTTDMLYAKLKNYHSSRMTFNGKQIFTKLEFTMDFRWSSSIAMGPSCVIHLVIECDVGATGAIFWLSMCKVIFLITTNDNDIVVIQFSSLLLVIM